jgi:hypothetical protein
MRTILSSPLTPVNARPFIKQPVALAPGGTRVL